MASQNEGMRRSFRKYTKGYFRSLGEITEARLKGKEKSLYIKSAQIDLDGRVIIKRGYLRCLKILDGIIQLDGRVIITRGCLGL